jgi:hypothetical protein
MQDMPELVLAVNIFSIVNAIEVGGCLIVGPKLASSIALTYGDQEMKQLRAVT